MNKSNIALGALLGLALSSRTGQAQNLEEAAAIRAAEVQKVEGLVTPDLQARREALDRLSRERGFLRNALIAEVKRQKTHPDDAFDGPFWTLVRAIQYLDVREAAGELSSMVAFQLDPATAPKGAFNGPTAYYPVALTLAKIGKREQMESSMIHQILRASEGESLRPQVYVLAEVLGRAETKLALQNELEKFKDRPEDVPGPIALNFKKALAVLEEWPAILLEPKTRAVSQQTATPQPQNAPAKQ